LSRWRSEDELAGLIGHEISRIIARRPTIELTRELKQVLGVTQWGIARTTREMEPAAGQGQDQAGKS
jgi:predicted Zn-dependent protease